jgi:8-oxo-dGTP diphosphatase
MMHTAVRERQKVVLYITSQNHLLVFREPKFPEVGWQPPGGTVMPGETIGQACRRELVEETGIEAPESGFSEIGRETYEYVSVSTLHRHHRTFCHAEVSEPVDRVWEHVEEFPDGGDSPILFELSWRPLAQDFNLFASLDAYLVPLKRSMGIVA